jgi:hypothetical protein
MSLQRPREVKLSPGKQFFFEKKAGRRQAGRRQTKKLLSLWACGVGFVTGPQKDASNAAGTAKLGLARGSKHLLIDSKIPVVTLKMTLPPRLFMRLVDGRAGGIANVAYVPTEIGVLFSSLTHDVKLSSEVGCNAFGIAPFRYECIRASSVQCPRHCTLPCSAVK